MVEEQTATAIVRLDRAALHAVAHPLRMRLVGLLRLEGPATASQLARRLDTNSGATSYHLRQLAEAGLVEEASELGNARDRYWRATAVWSRWDETDFLDDPDDAAAAEWLSAYVLRQHRRWLEDFWGRRRELTTAWRSAAALSDVWLQLTPDELSRLHEELLDVLDRWQRRGDPSPDAERVAVLLQAFPSPDPLR